MDNIILLTDSYKVSHYRQYPPKTEYVYSYFESRGGRWQDIVFFGLQYYLKRYLAGQVVTQEKIDEADELFAVHFGDKTLFNRSAWEYILHEHNGNLPVLIKAVPEGTPVPSFNVLMTVENTDPACYWLTNYLETLLVQVWYASTVATQSREMRYLITKYLNRTGTAHGVDAVDAACAFKLHDFGYRGVSSVESAGIGGAAHLISFKGTDTLAGLLFAKKYYNEPMAGYSIPAAEHSTITSWGQEHEVDAMNNMLSVFPAGTVAVVSDSFNIFEACSNLWGTQLKDTILSRNGTLVIRPDSGDPVQVLIKGQPNVFDILSEKFGYYTNDNGFKILNDKIRVIQGDGIDFETIDSILYALQQKGYSADNITFGSGGALLQKLNRDTLKFAFKCSSIVVDGVRRDVFKNPVTDKGKQSKRGCLRLVRKDNAYYTKRFEESSESEDCLVDVFCNGNILQKYTFNEIRENAKAFY
ncbi:MAG: nicotinate phosphoribosyltransferase [Planctomycetaceae bacterium]|jgi:nicotinamide phosphoribosyltransferase|nr:nicotinate phosphoribosyltransferase [Planctomycetaceae bacterium]